MKRTLLISMLAAALVALPASGAIGAHKDGHEGGPSGDRPAKAKGPKGDQGAKGLAKRTAARRCREERRTLGKEAFRAKYGDEKGRKAMRNCKREELPEARADARNASQECRAERSELGAEAFREKYGTNRNKRNAFGKCVSGKVKAADEPEPEPEPEPAPEPEPTTEGTA